jgi:hypothetical protein
MSEVELEPASGADWKRLRRFVILQVALIVGSVAVVLAGWGSVVQLERRRDAVQRELADKQKALRLTNEQLLAADRRVRELTKASETAERKFAEQRKLLAEVQRALPASNGLKDRVTDAVEKSIKDEQLVKDAAQLTRARSVYVHYADETQQARAEALAAVLRAEKYKVRNPINLARNPGKPANDMTQVRFMHAEDRGAALEILAVLQANGIRHSRISYVPIPSIPRGRIEIWFEAGEIR